MPCLTPWRPARLIAKNRFIGQYPRPKPGESWGRFGAGDGNARDRQILEVDGFGLCICLRPCAAAADAILGPVQYRRHHPAAPSSSRAAAMAAAGIIAAAHRAPARPATSRVLRKTTPPRWTRPRKRTPRSSSRRAPRSLGANSCRGRRRPHPVRPSPRCRRGRAARRTATTTSRHSRRRARAKSFQIETICAPEFCWSMIFSENRASIADQVR